MKSFAVFLASVLAFGSADATLRRWVSNGSTSWNVAANWSGGVVPVANTDDVLIDGTGSAICNVDVVTASVNSFTMSAGTLTFSGVGELHVGGTLGGGFAITGGTFTAGSGTVVFDGTTFSTYINTVGTTFNNVTLFKTGGASLTLLNDMTVNGTLNLAQQNLLLGNNNLVLAGTLVGGGNNGWIITNGSGVFKRMNVGANTLFPIGTSSSSYTPVIIHNTGTPDGISVRIQTGFGGLVGPTNPNVVVNLAWIITEDVVGGSNATITLSYRDGQFTPVVFDVTNNYIARYTTRWEPTAANEVFNSIPYTSSATFTAFGPFGITSDLQSLPVQLASFTGSFVNSTVRLNWRTISEINNYGFSVQRRQENVTEWTELANSFVAGHGTTNEPHDYLFTDNTATGGSLHYRLKQVDLDGTEHFSEPITVSSPTSVGEGAPVEFALKQNYPNPFNPSTEIKFSVEATAPASLEVFNALGQKVATLYDEVAIAGQYYKVRFDAASLATGVYYYRLQSGNKIDMKKLLLLK